MEEYGLTPIIKKTKVDLLTRKRIPRNSGMVMDITSMKTLIKKLWLPADHRITDKGENQSRLIDQEKNPKHENLNKDTLTMDQ